MNAVLFAGPSIFGIEPAIVGEVDLEPPAACGDLLRAARNGAEVIGLVDGVFESCPSVWHKEILAILGKGIRVFGAASMGALRAAECAPFGMVGVGSIFADYSAGRRVADADVAVLHAPAELGFRPLTEALVNVEATVGRLICLDRIDLSEKEKLIAAARKLHFKQRNWDRIFVDAALSKDRIASLASDVVNFRVNQKLHDATLLIDRMKNGGEETARPARFVNRTVFQAALERTIATEDRTPAGPA